MKTKRPQIKRSSDDELDVIQWLKNHSEETVEKQILRDEEWTKYNLAEALAQAREASGHTQSSLAQELGIRQSLVSKWEHIDHNHTLETLLNLTRTTGAKLVLGFEVKGKLIPISSASERCILLTETVYANLEQRAKSVGLTVQALLLAPLAATSDGLLTTTAPKIKQQYEPAPGNVLPWNSASSNDFDAKTKKTAS